MDVYESLRREHRIRAALVLGYEGEAAYRGNNEYVAQLAAKHDWIAALAFTPLDAPRVPCEPFAGITIFLTTPEDVGRFAAWPRATFDALSSAGMIVSVNAVPETLARAREPLLRLEGCAVLISHLGQPGAYERPPADADVSAVLRPLLSLARAQHIGVKLSGLYDVSIPAHDFPHRAAQPFIARIADAFGSERLYWGSDFSPALDHVSFAQTISAVSDLSWSTAERTAILGGNLRRLLRKQRRTVP